MVKIKWTEPAAEDLNSIHGYISRSSKIYATRIVKSIINATVKLESMPRIGRKVPEFDTDELREIIYDNFRIIYYIKTDNDIDILAIMHSSREIRQAILDRL